MNPPPEGTIERWAWDYVLSTELSYKLSPPSPPREWERDAAPRRLASPGRPTSLILLSKAQKTPGPNALRDPLKRASLVHTFLHHEVQAAELMCWALLAFPGAPEEFKRGVLGIYQDELRHVRMYGEYLTTMGVSYGQHPVRDWFWSRVPAAPSPSHFVAVMGMGLEAGNLDHASRFSSQFREVGDRPGADVQARVCEEEVSHVRFGLRWFERWAERVDLETWVAHLPPPLSPAVFKGPSMNVEARLRAGFSRDFLDALGRWKPASGA